MLMTTQSAKRFLSFQKSGYGPTHDHCDIAIACDTSTP
jgi:hypothetical protein